MTVSVPVADMRTEPDHRSQRKSQLIYGHGVTVEERRAGFVLVYGDDDYHGWVAESYLSEPDSSEQQTEMVMTNFASLRIVETGGTLILPHGAMLRVFVSGREYRRQGQKQKLRRETGEVVSPAAADPVAVARQFESCPYLWGGTSPYGFDCSGLIQAVFRRSGMVLPRDSKEQSAVGAEVPFAASRPGDLIFFPGHVALHLGSRRIIHATRLRGMVAVESLDPAAPDCRLDLVEKVTAVKRITPGPEGHE